jgi:hypothetical protein
MGQSQRTLPRVPATRALPHKTTHPPTQCRARVDDKTLCLNATQNARTTSRPAGDAPHNGWRISRRRAERSEAKPVGWMRLLCRLPLFGTNDFSPLWQL